MFSFFCSGLTVGVVGFAVSGKPTISSFTTLPQGVKKVQGGKERQDSGFNALLEAYGEVVVIHDCARPFASLDLFYMVSNLGEYQG